MSLKKFVSVAFIIGLVIGFSASFFIFQAKIVCPICKYEPVSIHENQVLPLTDQQYFAIVNAFLSSANASVHIIMFEIKYYPNYPESNENKILDTLIKLKKNGIDVKIITDEYLTENSAFEYLKNNGIDIKYDSKERTTHSKLIIIDGKIVIVGSTNWSYYAIDKNREANVIIYSEKISQQFEQYFDEAWKNL